MEIFVTLLIPAMLAVILVRLVVLPMGFAFKLASHACCGFLCLWLLNTIAGFTGVYFPVNAITVLIAGILGAPGIGVMALLEIMG